MNIKISKHEFYEVKRGRGRNVYWLVSPYEWEPSRKYTDRAAAEFDCQDKNAAIINKMARAARLAASNK
jgi:hypothetical protein